MNRKQRKYILIGVVLLQGLMSACGSGIETNGNGFANGEEMVFETEEQEEDLNIIGEVDPCLVGTWEMDNDSLLYYLSKNMNTTQEITFVMNVVEGNLIWEFEAWGDMNMRSDSPLVISIEIIANDTMLGTSEVRVGATGTAMYVNYGGGMLVSGGADYEFTGDGSFTLSADSALTGEATVTLTPGQFTARVEDLDQEYTFMDEALDGEAQGLT
ncbi:MAG: hypothetical protein N2D54_05905, partial [Chloroflexota bacterium]